MAEHLVVFTEGADGPHFGLDREIIRRAGGSLLCAQARNEAERIKMAQRAEVVVAGNAPITRDFLSALPQLRGVVRAGIGVDAVDLMAATELGIVVANVPDFCKEEVAEHTLALIFAVRHGFAILIPTIPEVFEMEKDAV